MDTDNTQDAAEPSLASAGSGVDERLCAALRRTYESASSDYIANSLKQFAWDARLDAMPAKFRYAMLEAAKRLE